MHSTLTRASDGIRHFGVWRSRAKRNITRVPKRSKAGFTLLEAVIAIFVLGATATVFFAFLPTAIKTGKMVGNHQQASSLIQHKIDQLRGVGYGRLTYTELADAGIIDPAPTTSPYSFAQVDGLGEIYITPVATVTVEDYNTQVKQVTVTLTWTGSHAQQGNGSLTTRALIAKG